MNDKKNEITQKKVLIIDDEDVICKACKMVLNEQEVICDHCLSGEEGIERVMEQDYDLLLLDMKLKEMDGMDILKRVKEEKPELYVIVITGYSTIANTVKAMKLGANDYLSKPFADHELIDAVNALLDSE
ncbi:two-component system, NtrC family, nitrogen regulation response regulator NtrX [Desulfocicer vacuolatum DSM 3385]|uniref:Two-component system, NtrC family, nitrogen regulation response regulator NtrX n=1 Tax=Desulfocicer vacuolatum DSM 3385 TaxID=1121400 RepID=A0A1W2EG95_9BACT|nr:response regulator [Desulfocicer vacuolatum]SMD08774.1 two-component system, NtrC family, nitrogen regulation response regulator NtrX [Desulfocicer vacuolatum DSM 3385]